MQTLGPVLTAPQLALIAKTADPSSPPDGSLWFNSTDGKLRARIGGVTVDLNITPGGAAVYTVEVDFGATPVSDGQFTITDSNVNSSSKLSITQSGAAPTGRSADENEMTALIANGTPGSGQFILNAFCLNGTVVGKHKFNYIIG